MCGLSGNNTVLSDDGSFLRYLQHVEVEDAGAADVVLSLYDPLQVYGNVLCLQVLANHLVQQVLL